VFGVGDDVNAHLLDQVAEDTRATSIYVRPMEDLEVKVSSFYAKISHPVMTDLKLSLASDQIKLKEIYPPQLPDLFHGSQLVLLGRYSGDGESMLTLTGKVGSMEKEITYEVKLPEEKKNHVFVADLWARRKVGYLLDQIRLKGENKELVDEVIMLAKKYGIATPYTSYLVLPDEKEVARLGIAPAETPAFAADGTSEGRAIGGFGRSHGGFGGGGFAQDARESRLAESLGGRGGVDYVANEAKAAGTKVAPSVMLRRQAGRQAVNVAEALAELKDARSHGSALSRRVAGTTFSPLRGIWIDAAYKDGAEIVKIQYLSDAYFRVIELVPNAREVFALGERIVWQTPSGKAIVVDAEGEESVDDEAIRVLFMN
jgi:Ca-activated chloride channel family protein